MFWLLTTSLLQVMGLTGCGTALYIMVVCCDWYISIWLLFPCSMVSSWKLWNKNKNKTKNYENVNEYYIIQIVDYVFDYIRQDKIFLWRFHDTPLTPNSFFFARKSFDFSNQSITITAVYHCDFWSVTARTEKITSLVLIITVF